MHILFLTHYFPPEVNAPATRTFEHARRWVAQGHDVTVITCAPNCPTGQVCCLEGLGGGTMCSSTNCTMPDGGFPGTGQVCEDACECRGGGTCSTAVSVGTNPPQQMLKCAP